MKLLDLKREEARRVVSIRRYDNCVIQPDNCDSVNTKYETRAYVALHDDGPTSKMERARKVVEEVSEADQYENVRWADNDPINQNKYAELKEDVDELKELVEDGVDISVKEDPEFISEVSYHFCYTKTTNGDCNFERMIEAENATKQQQKLDWGDACQAHILTKGGFF